MLKLVSLFTALLLVSGCYQSQSDLIGSRATTIVSANTLLVHNGTAYFYRAPDDLCTAKLAPGAKLECANPSKVALERTVLGNYLVQVGSSPTQYYYLLWFRTHDALTTDCVVELGADVPGLSAASAVASAALNSKVPVSLGVLPSSLESRLIAGHRDARIADRQELMEIVSLYESSFASLSSCTQIGGSRLGYDRSQLQIAGDRRHLPDYELQ